MRIKVSDGVALSLINDFVHDFFTPEYYYLKRKRIFIYDEIFKTSTKYTREEDSNFIKNLLSITYFEFFSYQTTVLKDKISRKDKIKIIKTLKKWKKQ